MKLKLGASSVDTLKSTLTPIVTLRKHAVVRFTPTHLNIISSAPNEPQLFCTLSKDIFDTYDVESIRENTISLEINVDQLLQVLRQYERSDANELAMRLSRKEQQGKRQAYLVLFFQDYSGGSIEVVNHCFNIFVRLLRRDKDALIVEPELGNVDVMMKLPSDVNALFKRIERYKTSDFVTVRSTAEGQLSLVVMKEDFNVSVTWNELLKVQQETEATNDVDDEDSHEVEIMVRAKDWKLGAKISEACQNRVLIISKDEALVFHCFLDDEEQSQIIYFINAVKP